MKVLKVAAWLAAGSYFMVVAMSGNVIGAMAAVACGWFAGKTAYAQDDGK